MSGWNPAGKVDVEEMLQNLDIENIRREGFHEWRFSCPFSGHENGDQSASCYMNDETTMYHCHGCKKSGNAVSFSCDLLGISPVKAKKLLREVYDPASFNPDERTMVDEVQSIWNKKKQKNVTEQNEVYDESVLLDFDIDWIAVSKSKRPPKHLAYMLDERGFDPETLEEWRFGWDSMKKRISFPVRDHEGNFIGMKGRSVDGRTPKYLMLGNGTTEDRYEFGRFLSGQVIFGLDRAKHHAQDGLIIVEGELDCVSLWQMGYKNVVALNGSRLTNQHKKLLLRYTDRVIFFFDSDKAGDRGLWGYVDEKEEFHPGALQRLSLDLSISLVHSEMGDANDHLRKGLENELAEAFAQPQTYMQAVISRRASGLVVS